MSDRNEKLTALLRKGQHMPLGWVEEEMEDQETADELRWREEARLVELLLCKALHRVQFLFHDGAPDVPELSWDEIIRSVRGAVDSMKMRREVLAEIAKEKQS